jgi:hypothetical protein
VSKTDEQGSKDMTDQMTGFAPVPSDPDDGKVWVLVADNPAATHVEVFTRRPQTVAAGGDPLNWPATYRVFEGYPDGGDSVCVEDHPPRPSMASCGHPIWRDGYCAAISCPNYIGRHQPSRAAIESDRLTPEEALEGQRRVPARFRKQVDR